MCKITKVRDYLRTVTDNTDLECAKVLGMFIAYVDRWGDEGWVTTAKELPLRADIHNPVTKEKCKETAMIQYLDGIIEGHGMKLLCEHKTTSQDLYVGSPYWTRVMIDSQVENYLIGALDNGITLDGVMYDVVKKHSYRPKRRVNAADYKLAFVVREKFNLDLLVNDVGQQESLQHYVLRTAGTMMQDTHRFFGRQLFKRTPEELLRYMQELWDIKEDILHGKVYRNDQNCLQYNTPCEFMSLCTGQSHESDTLRWRERERRSDDEFEDDGRVNLSHSRIACFKSCRQKHHYKYVRKIEANTNKPKSDALMLGSLWHNCLEVAYAPEGESNE